MSLNSQSSREWLRHRNDSPELIAEASRAIDSFDAIVETPDDTPSQLEDLAAAAAHPRFVVWDLALHLLSLLAVTIPQAREFLVEMSHSPKMEYRRRSIQYPSGLSLDFCVEMLTRLLKDRSSKVRAYAASRIESCDLKQLLPILDAAILCEGNENTRNSMTHNADILRHGFVETEAPHYSICIRMVGGYCISIQYLKGQQLSSQIVQEIGVENIRRELLQTVSVRSVLRAIKNR